MSRSLILLKNLAFLISPLHIQWGDHLVDVFYGEILRSNGREDSDLDSEFKPLAGLLILVIAIQSVLLGIKVIEPLYSDIATVKDSSSWTRSAQLSFGDRFTSYMDFLRTNIPKDARVVIPPLSIDSTYGNQGIVQFFLFPRSIVNCPDVALEAECLSTFDGASTYFLYIDGFPSQGVVGETLNFLQYDHGLGLYSPRDSFLGDD